MGDFSTGFGTGFEIGTIIKEKQRAKKILQEVQETLQEWKMSGVEPSYVDKIMMSTLLNQAGASYATSFANIENDKNAMDREKLSQDALNLRTMNDNGMNLIKMIQTAAKEGTLGLIDWFQVPKEMLPPNFDLNKFLDKDTITKLQDESTRQEALNNITGVAKILPEEYRKSYLEQGGVIPEGLQPTTTPKAPGISDYKGAVDYLKNFSKITTPPDTFNKVKAGLQNKFPDIDLSDITQESLREPEAVAGVEKPKAIPAPTSIENIREDIRNADTPEDARRIYNNGVQQYGEEAFTKAVGITEVDKFWAEGQIPYLDKIKTSIGNIIDEKGWLKKGTLTSAEVGVDFEGDQKVEEIYEMLRKEYMKYFDMLTKMGLPLLEFPILKPLEEIEKVGLGEGFWGWGKQRGQYKSIYK